VKREWRWRWLAGAGGLLVVIGLVLAIVLASGSSEPRRRVTSTPVHITVPPSLAAAKPAPAGEQLGASVNLLFNTPGLPGSLLAVQLRALRATGATIARSDAFWEASEPQAPVHGVHHYVWAFDDRVAGLLALFRLRWLPILDYSAPWAESTPGQDHSAPRSASDYAAYAGAFAARYGPGGSFWREHPSLPDLPVQTFEIWNEPDNSEFWSGGANAALYAELYAQARVAIDAADPSARVIVGGLTNAGAYLPALLSALPELRGHIDGVAVHPYGTPAVVLGKLAAARATMDSLGMESVPLYATEFGWTTYPPGSLDYVAAARRPAYIASTLAELGQRVCGLVLASFYTWYSARQNPADPQDWFGIDSSTGAPTADTDAFTAGLHEAAAPGPGRPCG
jgi:hypothetical protein